MHCYVKVDEEPAIRANTTILLGNLANYLSEAACKRVLLNAFTRALKDSFPPARVAGVKVCRMPFPPSYTAFWQSTSHQGLCLKMQEGCGCMQALQATAQRYSPEEIAVRAVPALAPLSVDPVAQVSLTPNPVLNSTLMLPMPWASVKGSKSIKPSVHVCHCRSARPLCQHCTPI